MLVQMGPVQSPTLTGKPVACSSALELYLPGQKKLVGNVLIWFLCFYHLNFENQKVAGEEKRDSTVN